MTVDELITLILSGPPLSVPATLTRHFQFVYTQLPILMERLQAQSDDAISIRAAMLWIMALSATQGAVLHETSEQPELTAFGAALLNDVVMGTLSVNGDET